MNLVEQTLDAQDNLDNLPAWVGGLLRENQRLKGQNVKLQEQINLLLHKRFGANSEKYRAEQSDLFNEAEAYADESDVMAIAGSGLSAPLSLEQLDFFGYRQRHQGQRQPLQSS